MFGRSKESPAPAGDHPEGIPDLMALLLDRDLALWIESLPPEQRPYARKLWIHGWYGGFQDSHHPDSELTPCPVPA